MIVGPTMDSKHSRPRLTMHMGFCMGIIHIHILIYIHTCIYTYIRIYRYLPSFFGPLGPISVGLPGPRGPSEPPAAPSSEVGVEASATQPLAMRHTCRCISYSTCVCIHTYIYMFVCMYL